MPEGAGGRFIVRAVQCDVGAAPQQRQRGEGAGNAAADQRDILRCTRGRPMEPRRRVGRRRAVRRQRADQHFALLAEAFGSFHRKARLLQAAAYKTGGGKGGEAAARPGEARHGGEQLLAPHIGVFRRSEAVEEPGVDLIIDAVVEARQQRVDIAEPQVERYAALRQQQAVAAGQRLRPAGAQPIGVRRQLRPAGVRRRQIRRLQRKFLKADKVQALQRGVGIGLQMALKRLPQG